MKIQDYAGAKKQFVETVIDLPYEHQINQLKLPKLENAGHCT